MPHKLWIPSGQDPLASAKPPSLNPKLPSLTLESFSTTQPPGFPRSGSPKPRTSPKCGPALLPTNTPSRALAEPGCSDVRSGRPGGLNMKAAQGDMASRQRLALLLPDSLILRAASSPPRGRRENRQTHCAHTCSWQE
jgi:hypothetical protein